MYCKYEQEIFQIQSNIIRDIAAKESCIIVGRCGDWILRDMDRGVTQLTSRGGWTGAERPTLLCVIGRSEIMSFKRILREEDENAFVIIVEAHEAIGDGFTSLSDGTKR